MNFNLFKNKIYSRTGLMTFALLSGFSLQVSNVKATDLYDSILQDCKGAFKAAATQEEQFAAITKPIDRDYFGKLRRQIRQQEDHIIKSQKLYPGSIETITSRSHPLALAICKADIKHVGKFLKAIDNPNDPALLMGGYRQIYNLVTLAADPVWLIHESHSLADRLMIITLLGEFEGKNNTTFDFNFIPTFVKIRAMGLPYSGGYNNAPLHAARAIHGGYNGIFTEDNTFKCQEAVEARLMLYGADPKPSGSSAYGIATIYSELEEDEKVERQRGVDKRMGEYSKLALNQAVEERLNLKFLRPTSFVQKYLKEQKQNALKDMYFQREMLILENTEEADSNELDDINEKIRYLENWKL